MDNPQLTNLLQMVSGTAQPMSPTAGYQGMTGTAQPSPTATATPVPATGYSNGMYSNNQDRLALVEAQNRQRRAVGQPPLSPEEVQALVGGRLQPTGQAAPQRP
jgi:hypothetical protein